MRRTRRDNNIIVIVIIRDIFELVMNIIIHSLNEIDIKQKKVYLNLRDTSDIKAM